MNQHLTHLNARRCHAVTATDARYVTKFRPALKAYGVLYSKESKGWKKGSL